MVPSTVQTVGGDTGKGGSSQAWRDNFNGAALDAHRWANVSGQAPGYRPGLHIGYYAPTSVRVANGVWFDINMLCMICSCA
jgi:hypothetical protein